MKSASFLHKAVFKLLLCILTNTCLLLHAQIVSSSFEHPRQLALEQGLADNIVYCSLQDKKGFLWFLTESGLQRYDGYSFKTYSYSPEHPDYLLSGFFNNMLQDANGILWISDSNSGIWSFDPLNESFQHYVHHSSDLNSLSDDQTSEIQIDKQGYVWIGNYKTGLDRFDPRSYTFKHYTHHQDDSASISNNYVKSICLDEDDNLWIATSSPGIDYFNTKTGKVTKHYSYGSKQKNKDDQNAGRYGVYKGINGNIWIGSYDNGMFCFNTRTGNMRHFLHDKSDPFSISQNTVTAIFEDSFGNILVSGATEGFDFFDNEKSRFYFIPNIKLANTANATSPFMEDHSHNIWIGTTEGLLQINSSVKSFRSFRHLKDDVHTISGNVVCSFLRLKDGRFFTGSDRVNIMNDDRTQFSTFAIYEKGKNILDKSDVWQIYQDQKGIVWFCTTNGLVQYDPINGRHHWYQFDSKDVNRIGAQSVTGIIEDRKGRYWVTTNGGGVNAFYPQSGKFKRFDESNSKITTNAVGGILEDRNGILYLGSLYGGLITFNPENEEFKTYRYSKSDKSSISCDLAADFLETDNGIIWIATNGGGICAFNPRTEKFRTFSKKDGLCSDAAITLVEDNYKNLWIGTLNGISCFSPPKDPFNESSKYGFRNYSTSDGLPMRQINYFASYKDVDGTIYFGTKGAGMYSFVPGSFKDNRYIPPVFITSFSLFNTEVTNNDSTHILKTSVEDSHEIKLNYEQNFISFSFTALNYFHTENNKYAYRLKEFNNQWIYTDAANRYVNYTNLDPGEYVFEVKGSNNDGVWNNDAASVHLIITPPYWQTSWFKAFIIILTASFIILLYKYRMREIYKLQTIRNKIAGDLHDDIGSTLNSISIYSEVLRKRSQEEIPELTLIGDSARMVIDSMSDIVWTINPENDSFEKIAFRMRSITHSLMKAKKIDYTFKVDENLNDLKMPMITRRNFYLIFKEAMNNLVKYSFATRVSVSLVCVSNEIELQIKDNGCGFDFNNSTRGNGLLNMTRRANEINAVLYIESYKGQGTSIRLLLKK
jgi:ligand-binding sensor domain-containing protein/two-component sensor histidine kinase